MKKKILIIFIALVVIVAAVILAVTLSSPFDSSDWTYPYETSDPSMPNISENPLQEGDTYYTVTYDYGEYSDGVRDNNVLITGTRVKLGKPFEFAVPTSNDAAYVFIGWFESENGIGIKYTDETGKGTAWSIKSDVTVYAYYAKVFEFIRYGNEYSVGGGVDIDKVQKLVIPDTYNDLPVTSIDSFMGCETIKQVFVPKFVNSISDMAFNGCKVLTEIQVDENNDFYVSADGVLYSKDMAAVVRYPMGKSGDAYALNNSCKTINDHAFDGCMDLHTVTWDNVTSIGKYAFKDSGLYSIDLDGIGTVAEGTFYGCTLLKNAVIPEGVIGIGAEAFKGCGIESIELPSSLKTMGVAAFADCACAESLTFSVETKLTAISAYTFSGCGKLSHIILPTGLSYIGERAFMDCLALIEMKIPDKVTRLEKETFKGCTALTHVTLPQNIMEIGESAFNGCGKLIDVALPQKLMSIRSKAFFGCTSIDELIIPKSVMGIEKDAFVGIENITVSPDNNYIAIEDGILYGLQNGDKTTLRVNVREVAGVLIVPETVTAIEEDALSGTDITEVIIPRNVSEIGSSAFMDCKELSKVTFIAKSSLSKINKSVFKGCVSLSNFTVPENVTNIAECAFEGCRSLSTVNFTSDMILSIGEKAFKDSAITFIKIPDSVQLIGAEAFSGCIELTEIILPNTLTVIEMSLFLGCTSIKEIVIPPSVIKVESNAFYGWTEEQTIIIPYSEGLPPDWSADWNNGCNAKIMYK